MLRFGFFDSEITGYDDEGMPIFDRAESSDFMAMFISKIIADGVLALPGDCFQVIAYEGMNLKIRPGFAIMRGRFVMNAKEDDVTIPDAPADIGFKRIDRIILRVNYLERKCEIIVRAGVPSETPIPPGLIRPEAGDYFEMCLASVTVNPKQTTITQSDITDTRLDSDVCGLVTQAIDHLETSVFYAQMESFLESKRSELTAKVTEYETWKNEFADQQKDTFDALNTDYESQMKQFMGDSAEKYNSWYTENTAGWEGQFSRWFTTNTENWTEEFLKFFNVIKGQLSEDAAGNLQNQIYSINAVLREITDDEIDRIVNGTYEEDDEGGYEPDIYSRVTDEEIVNIVDNAFSDV